MQTSGDSAPRDRGLTFSRRHPRRRVTQYPRDGSDRPRSRSVLDPPPEPVIELAKGETSVAGMTGASLQKLEV